MLLQAVEKHLKATRMSPTRFGRAAVGDPKFVFQLRNGRTPRKRTVRRVLAYLAAAEAAGKAAPQAAPGTRWGFEPARYVRRGILVAGRPLTWASHDPEAVAGGPGGDGLARRSRDA